MNNEMLLEGKVFVVANRLPVNISKRKKDLRITQSPGGLASMLRVLQEYGDVKFIGWPGYWTNNPTERKEISEILAHKYQSYPIFIRPADLSKFYYGFSNRTLWPLFHYFSSYCTFERTEWEAYRKINNLYLQKILDLAGPKDLFWIHDYHLMLLPALLRKNFPDSSIGFFLHIPFPSSEIFRLLPWRKQILEGLIAADLIGFHTYEYARHFLSSALRLLGYEHEFGFINIKNRVVKVENFPMGIDYRNIENLVNHTNTRKEIIDFKKKLGAPERKIVLSVDRLDYTKGIPNRLEGLEQFLNEHPEWHNRFVYLMLCVPSRTQVKNYQLLREEVERLVGRINGSFGKPGWMPIHYMYRSLPFEKLMPLYASADVAMVCPVRDGMNLVAKEYVASRSDNKGVLILSETAGAAFELGEAVLVNVNDKQDISSALKKALEMSPNEQSERMKIMRKRLKDYDIFHWTHNFIRRIIEVKKFQSIREYEKIDKEIEKQIVADYRKSENRLLILNIDGLSGASKSKLKKLDLDKPWIRSLKKLAEDPGNTIVIMSRREHEEMDNLCRGFPCGLMAEQGIWIKKNVHSDWEKLVSFSNDWKNEIKPVFNDYVVRVPGSFIDEKEFVLAWNYQKSDPELGNMSASELFDYLSDFLANTGLQVTHGNKLVDVRVQGMDKGNGVRPWLLENNWDFILVLGEDWSDEDIFKIMPDKAYSIKITPSPTHAKYYLESQESARKLMTELTKSK
ncbi:MAG: bifunctional alpha,alpha-trehalose-phosphate synthase (UDP-forming)/trehalose-phosphatase [Candidatus Aminicenantes bacterium]|nr:bifunctional alpha,alpha-trehalose-phosphate synthase (UDP-forming)/trehalose-phosphatase [Candidatus Aminicenantes bacterium]